MADAHFSIKAAAKRTGLTPHVIRVWEKRYGAVRPSRTQTNRRLYSDVELQRLGMLRRATRAGHSIGAIATLTDEELSNLVSVEESSPPPPPAPHKESPARQFLSQGLAAVRQLNTLALDETLSRAIVAMGQHGVLEQVIGPLAKEIGEAWREGVITAAHEHFASAVIRSFLARNSRPFTGSFEMPSIVVCTPAGQLHELGAVMIGAAANDLGWRVIYLGPSLPAAEIAGAAVQNQARAVALSIVYPEDDTSLSGELENLRRYLPSTTKIIVGGRASHAYQESISKIGAVRAVELKEFYAILETLRSAGKRNNGSGETTH